MADLMLFSTAQDTHVVVRVIVSDVNPLEDRVDDMSGKDGIINRLLICDGIRRDEDQVYIGIGTVQRCSRYPIAARASRRVDYPVELSKGITGQHPHSDLLDTVAQIGTQCIPAVNKGIVLTSSRAIIPRDKLRGIVVFYVVFFGEDGTGGHPSIL